MPEERISRWFLFYFCVAVMSFLCLISSGNLDSEDSWLYASVARNIYYHHQIAAAPDEYPDLNVHMNMTKGVDGIWRAHGGLGYSLSLVPAIFISDMIHRAYGVTPPQHFPLEHDWSFHLFASFTNAFYGSLLAGILLLYANELGFSRKSSVLISVLTLGTTSLLPLTKFSFTHMMFIAFLTTSFYFIRRFGTTQKIKYLVYSAISFCLMAISYNETFTLTIIPLGLYLLAYETPKQRRFTLFLGFLGGLGMLVLLIALKSPFLGLILQTVKVYPKILFEGVWGFLLSPGKSIFLYSPPLLLIPIFWHKIKKTFRPELVAALALTCCYLYVIGSAFIMKLGLPQAIWHGGMNWGTRYIAVLIPLWMLIVFHIIEALKPLQKKLIVVPLFIVGAWIQLVGISTWYLLQYIDLPYNFFIGKTEIQVYDYASFIPRYTPLYTLSRQFIKIALDLPKTIARGKYDVRLFDGFDPPYKLATGTMRGFRQEGHISFKNTPVDKPTSLEFTLYNAPDATTDQQPAQISITLNGKELKKLVLAPQQEETLQFSSIDVPLLERNTLIFKASYAQPLLSPQVVYIKRMLINQGAVNLDSLDYPDMSTLGVATTPIPYEYSGKVVTDRWTFWNMRARIFERTLDFWWIKNLYFWDRPAQLIWGLIALNLSVLLGSSLLVRKFFSKEKSLKKP